MNPLETLIREIIGRQGAISLAAYMELALQHPEHGYYRVRQPIGRDGDFITAPEVSQMFGEMVGVWCAEAWRRMDKPSPFALVELGPGHGTMMQDILRATSHIGGFHEAKQLCLFDSDKALRAEQHARLDGAMPRYIERADQLPPMPAIVVANEFFDALPVRQFEKMLHGWGERMVTVSADRLALSLRALEPGEEKIVPAALLDARAGTIAEICPGAQSSMRDIARHIAALRGAMLVIDYGYAVPPGAATVQAVSRHQHASLFERPGEVDLTAHVDFGALADAARATGVEVSAPIGQGEFLKNLGIEIRADALKLRATLPQKAEIDAALARLTDDAQMGHLFKAIELIAY
jgi:NADH dehydrogenase [ubiquinone] 1 alpha subcomplex assembly factor 7